MLMSRLQPRPEFHEAVNAPRLVDIATKVLSLRPLRSTLPNRTKYRVRYVESLRMADEIFKRQVCGAPFEGRKRKTFIDLGSNVGYFTCFAADKIGRDAIGLAVDANLKMAEETKHHCELNGWERVKGVWAVFGFPKAPSNPNIPPKGKQTEITVPTIDLDKATLHRGELKEASRFGNWCAKRGWLGKDPFADIERTGRCARGKPQPGSGKP
jgi:hypothetical protein